MRVRVVTQGSEEVREARLAQRRNRAARTPQQAERYALGSDVEKGTRQGGSEPPADRPGRSSRRSGSRDGGEGYDCFGSGGQREDVSAACVGEAGRSGTRDRRDLGGTRPPR